MSHLRVTLSYILLTSFDAIHFFLAHHIMNIGNFWPLIFQFKFKGSQFQVRIFMMQPETIQVRIQISWSLVQGIQSLRFFFISFSKDAYKVRSCYRVYIPSNQAAKIFFITSKNNNKLSL